MVVAAALALFERQGYEHTPVDEIARQAGIGKSTLYRMFRGKEDILVAAVDPALVALASLLQEPGAADKSPGARVRYLLRRGIEVELFHLEAVTVLLGLRGNTAVQRRLLDRRRVFEHQMAELVGQAIEAGEFRPVDPRLTTRLLLSLANWMTAWYRRDGAMSAEQLAAEVITFAFDGLERR